MNATEQFDLVVIGSGPGGQRGAIAAAKLGARVALVERTQVGGAWVDSGTVPSKALRESIVHLAGRAADVVEREADVVRDQLLCNRVTIVSGDARFSDPHTISVTGEGGEEHALRADRVLLATGTRPARPEAVQFDGRVVVDSDELLRLDHLPESLIVVGAGVIGVEYASMFASLGTHVTIVERRDHMLEFCDREIVDALAYHLRDAGVTLRFGEQVTAVHAGDEGALAELASGERIGADVVLYSAGRQGNTETLGLERAGLRADARGRLAVDAHYCTEVDHIYAVGGLVGFPALASTAMEQGRRAGEHAAGQPHPSSLPPLLPVRIHTIPEISHVGRNEEELTAACEPYEVGIARYGELTRGRMGGDTRGLLKLLVAPDDGCLLGVHIFGAGATELVHVGQAVMVTDGTVHDLVDMVFNAPTLTEAHKVAALDATNRRRAVERHEPAILGVAS